MTADTADEMRELRLDYLADVREKAKLMKDHGANLGRTRQFKSSFPVLLFLSHQLKGSGGSLGFPRISELAKSMSEELNRYLESDSYPRRTPKELAETVTRVSDEMVQLVDQETKNLG